MKNITKTLIAFVLFSITSLQCLFAQDLSIGNISAGYDYNSSTGVISDIYFTILSNENTGASDFKVGVYFCIPGAGSYDDCYLLGSTDVPSINGNSALDVENWTIDVNDVNPTPPDGEYRLLIGVDYDDQISETNENNNTLYISPQGSNLTFTANSGGGGGPDKANLQIESVIYDFSNGIISNIVVKVKNAGSANADASMIEFAIEDNQQGSIEESSTLGAITAGSTTTYNHQDIDLGFIYQAGNTYKMTVIADPENTISESNENDNSYIINDLSDPGSGGGTTGLTIHSNSGKVVIPNPVSKSYIAALASDPAIKLVTLYSLTGQKVSLDNVKTGFYLITFLTAEQIYTQRILVE